MKGSLWWGWLAALAAVAVFAVLATKQGDDFPLAQKGPSSYERSVRADMCREAKEAGRYILAMSRTQADVVRVTDRLIAERKYPALGDETTALVGGMAGLALDSMTPEQFVREIEQSGVCSR